MQPTEQILTQVRASIDLLESGNNFIQHDFRKGHDEKFTHADKFQVLGVLLRLQDTNVGEGISEVEAHLLAKLLNSSYGITLTERGSHNERQLSEQDNPFIKLISLLRRYSLVKAHAIHVEIHDQRLPLDKPMELNSEALDAVYDAVSQRVEKLAESKTQGALFIQNVFADKAGASTSRGKFEAILRILSLGEAQELSLVILNNPRYNDALEKAHAQAQKHPAIAAASSVADTIEDIDAGRMPRRSFFRGLSEAFLGAAVAPTVSSIADHLIDNAEGGDRDAAITAAMKAIRSKRGDMNDNELRGILASVSRPAPEREVAVGAASSALTYYLTSQMNGNEDPMTKFLSALASECNKLNYPVIQFGAPAKGSGQIR